VPQQHVAIVNIQRRVRTSIFCHTLKWNQRRGAWQTAHQCLPRRHNSSVSVCALCFLTGKNLRPFTRWRS